MNTLKLLTITLLGIVTVGLSGCAVGYSDYEYDNGYPYYYGNPNYYHTEVVVRPHRYYNRGYYRHGVYINP